MPKQKNQLNNLNLDEDRRKKIGSDAVHGFTVDLQSRSEFDENNKEAYKLFEGVKESRSIPHLENPANVNVPLITIAALQFQARAYDSLVPGREIVRAVSTDGTSIDSARRVTKHINWQLLEEIEDWEEEVDKSLLMLPILGNAFKKTYRNFITNKNESELLSSSELVINYKTKNIKKAKRITHILKMTKSDLFIREQKEIFVGVNELFQDKKIKEIDKENIAGTQKDETLQDTVNQTMGLTDSELGTDERIILEQHTSLDLNDDGVDEDYIIWVDLETSKLLRITENKYIDPVTKESKKFSYFIHYFFIPNPESLYGFGFGLLLRHLTEAANSIINELIDAGNLANMQSGFIDSKTGISKGALNFKRGELKTVDMRIDDLKKGIFLFDFQPPSQALFALLGLLFSYGKEISSISDAMIGKLPPSDTTATSFMAVLEQGLKLFSVIHKRTHRAFKKEVKNLFILNSLFLNEKTYIQVQDSTSEEFTTVEIGRDDYKRNIDIIPVSDPTVVSKAEKVGKATQIYQFVLSNPLTQNNQQSIFEASKDLLIASEVQNWQKYLPDPSELPPTEFTPVEENARFLQELDSPILPTQDHATHLLVHQDFAESQFFEQMTPNGKNIFDAHIRETIGNIYLTSQEQGGLGGGEIGLQ